MFYYLIYLLILSPSLYAEHVEFKRDILALYDSSEGQDQVSTQIFENPQAGQKRKQKAIVMKGFREDRNPIFEVAQMPINHLGLKLSYWDVNQGTFPDEDAMKKYRGIITWFEDDQMVNAEQYCEWLEKQIRQGKKVLLMSEFGAERDLKTGKTMTDVRIQNVFRALGLQWSGGRQEIPWRLHITQKESPMVEFERTLLYETKSFTQVTSTSSKNKIYLSAQKENSNEKFDLVVVTPQGGYVAPEYALYVDEVTERKQWRLNPFLFFQKVFSVEDTPRPDTTTLDGKRILFIHIDGDGFINLSHIDRKRYSSELVLKEILHTYKIPHTVSVIAAEVDEKFFGNSDSLRIAKEIFALSHVEAGCHGYSHPMDWEAKVVGFSLRGYTFDSEKEIGGCRDRVQSLLPKDKKVKITLWSGACNPPSETLALNRKRGLANINGNDPFFDEDHPSYAYVSPFFKQKGGEIQPSTRAGSEYLYTEHWTENYGAFRNVIETFKRTEKPRRISPINIYYHFYIGERLPALNSLKTIYQWALSQNVHPIFTTQYIDILNGFLSTKIYKISSGWEIKDVGRLRTIRFDREMDIDRVRSKGIKEIKKEKGVTYIALEEEGPYRIILKRS